MLKNNICILIPVFNEEKTISKILTELNKLYYPYIIVNDGSTDNSEFLIKLYSNFPYISYNDNKGKGYAIKKGAKKLIKEGWEWILIVDSDGQCNLKDIERFGHAINNFINPSIIIGNRLSYHRSMPLIRLLTNKIMSFIISWIAKQKISDSQCGFRLIHRNVFNYIDLISNNFEFESEMLIKTGRWGFKIYNINIDCIYLKNRKSKIRPIKDGIKFLKMLFKLLI